MSAQIAVERDGPVLVVTLDRPDRLNAATDQMVEELLAACDEADADEAVRAVVLTGRGRAFCAGADLAAGSATFEYAEDVEHRDNGGVLALRLHALRRPLVAAVNGAAVGMGATMILPADVRLASTTARFAFPFTQRGIVPESCSSWFLPRIVGIGTALEWMYTGEMISADQALGAGLLRSTYAPEDLMPRALELAHRFASAAPASVVLARRLLWDGLATSHPLLAHEAESRALQLRGRSADAREGVAAFLEKREPQFSDPSSSTALDLTALMGDVGRPVRPAPKGD